MATGLRCACASKKSERSKSSTAPATRCSPRRRWRFRRSTSARSAAAPVELAAAPSERDRAAPGRLRGSILPNRLGHAAEPIVTVKVAVLRERDPDAASRRRLRNADVAVEDVGRARDAEHNVRRVQSADENRVVTQEVAVARHRERNGRYRAYEVDDVVREDAAVAAHVDSAVFA